MLTWVVSKEENSDKLLSFLKSKLPVRHSARQIKKAIEENHCQINDRTERFASRTLAANDIVIFNENALEVKSESLSFELKRVLYEDSQLLIYDKPSKTASDDPEFLKALQRNLPLLVLVHRLDKDTTGALIFAKTVEMEEMMKGLFKQHQIEKEYLAIVDKVPKKMGGIIDNYLGVKHRYQGQTLYGSVAQADGAHAITEWQCEKKTAEAALLRCMPKTGRTHQIRVHLSEMGHPILGDYQYGRQFQCDYRPERYMLHALALTFSHPVTHKMVKVLAPIPDDFQKTLDALYST